MEFNDLEFTIEPGMLSVRYTFLLLLLLFFYI